MTRSTFSKLLAWLDGGTDTHGERYVEMRRRLVAYFERRNRRAADELADETLNRIARTLEREGVIATPPVRYCYVMARFVLLDDVRRKRRLVLVGGSWVGRLGRRASAADEARAGREESLLWLERCLQQLKPGQRELIVEYYAGRGREKIERRRALARRLGITMNALAIRASRIRDGLLSIVDRRRAPRTPRAR